MIREKKKDYREMGEEPSFVDESRYADPLGVDNSRTTTNQYSDPVEVFDGSPEKAAENIQPVDSLRLAVWTDARGVRANKELQKLTIYPGQVWTDKITGQQLTIENIYHNSSNLRYSIKFIEKQNAEEFGSQDKASDYGTRDQIANIFTNLTYASGPNPEQERVSVGLFDEKSREDVPELSENSEGILTNNLPPTEMYKPADNFVNYQPKPVDRPETEFDSGDLTAQNEVSPERLSLEALDDVRQDREKVAQLLLEYNGKSITLIEGAQYKVRSNGNLLTIDWMKTYGDGEIEIKFRDVKLPTKMNKKRWAKSFINYIEEIK